MRLAIMQPYFFPYLGYFDLIHAVDHFVVYDSVQYIKHGWINRNRILKPAEGWQYVTAPIDKTSLHASYRTPIVDVCVVPGEGWKTRLLGQLGHYRMTAPFFLDTNDLVRRCLDNEERSISRLNVGFLSKVCDILRIAFSYSFSSAMILPTDPDASAQDRVLEICELLGATKYVNLPGGRGLYDEMRFRERGITLEFRALPPLTYSCRGREYIPDLSVIDVLMWNQPETVREHLEAH